MIGAAILAGALVASAQAQAPGSGNGVDEQTAMALPRVVLRGSPGVALPQPLNPSDAARVRRIFALQDRGRLADAQALIDDLDDRLLLGAILADRYLGRYHRSTAAELADWMDRFGDQPDAPAIHSLLLRRLAPGMAAPPAPAQASLDLPPAPELGLADDPDPQPGITRNAWLDRAVAARLHSGGASAALRLIDATRHLTPAYAAVLHAEIARTLFTANEDAAALQVATSAIRATPAEARVGQLCYIAGLAAWRLGNLQQARALFEDGAHASVASATVRAASAYWAARANARLHAAGAAMHWMRAAAQERQTLHGLVARRVLGLQTGIVPSGNLLAQADADAVDAIPAGRRALALLEVGQDRRAAAELRSVWLQIKDDAGMRRSVLLVAAASGLNDLASRFSALEAEADGRAAVGTSIKLPPLNPANGFHIDRALIYAVTRLESNFDSNAVSPAGARGLMQIMPDTARYIAGDPSLSGESLHDPAFNLALGQRYIAWLADQDTVDDNLLRLLAGYNAGVGNLAGWLAHLHDGGDPLLFLEAIPVDETRGFVRNVLTYTWLYAARLHLPAPSLDAMAAGEFPRFTALPSRGKLVAIAAHAD